MKTSGYRTFKICVSPSVESKLSNYAYSTRGVIELSQYFDENSRNIHLGDPGAETLHALFQNIVSYFKHLYEKADFKSAVLNDPTEYRWVTVAAKPQTIANIRELFEAARRIQNCETRVVHTAILQAIFAEGAE